MGRHFVSGLRTLKPEKAKNLEKLKTLKLFLINLVFPALLPTRKSNCSEAITHHEYLNEDRPTLSAAKM